MYPKKTEKEVKTTSGIRKTRNRMHHSLNRPIVYQPKNSSGGQYIPPAFPEVTELTSALTMTIGSADGFGISNQDSRRLAQGRDSVT